MSHVCFFILFAAPLILQEAGDRAAAAGQWGRALRHWDAALAAGAADAHLLHEAKAQASRKFEGPCRRTVLAWAVFEADDGAATRPCSCHGAEMFRHSCPILPPPNPPTGAAGSWGGLAGAAVRGTSGGAAARMGSRPPDAGQSAGGGVSGQHAACRAPSLAGHFH